MIEYDERVLEPRPWTVAQSEWAAELAVGAPPGDVLELCAGAGQIGLLAVAGNSRQLVCVDISPVACGYARRNAERAGLGQRVEVREGAIADAVQSEERFALVIADPPWVRRGDIGIYPGDPVLAIDGGDDGMDIMWTCLTAMERHLLPGGRGVLQVGSHEQVSAVAGVVEAATGSALALMEVRAYERGVLARLDRA